MNSSNFQVIREELASAIYNIELEIPYLKRRAAELWVLCNINDESTKLNFVKLNLIRSDLRRLKIRLKKLQSSMKEHKNERNPV